MWGDRSGREPARARSPLHLRRTYGLVGASLCLIGLIGVTAVDGYGWWSWILALLALVGVADAVVMTRRIGHRG